MPKAPKKYASAVNSMKNKIFSYAISSIISLSAFLLSSCDKGHMMGMGLERAPMTTPSGIYEQYHAEGDAVDSSSHEVLEEITGSISAGFDTELLVLGKMKEISEKNPKSVTPEQYQELMKEGVTVFSGRGCMEGVETYRDQAVALSFSNYNLTKNLTNVTQSRDRCIENTKELNEGLTHQRKENELLTSQVEAFNSTNTELAGALNDKTRALDQCSAEKSVLAQNNITQSQENELLTLQVAKLDSTDAFLRGALDNKTDSLSQCKGEKELLTSKTETLESNYTTHNAELNNKITRCEDTKDELNQNLTRQQTDNKSLTSQKETLELEKAELLGKLTNKTHSLSGCLLKLDDSKCQELRLNHTGFLRELKELRLNHTDCLQKLEDAQNAALLWGYPAERVAMGGIMLGGVLVGVPMYIWKNSVVKKVTKERDIAVETGRKQEKERYILEGRLDAHTQSQSSSKRGDSTTLYSK